MNRKGKAELLGRLHYGPEILVFPNAWDAVSARIIEAEGFPAIATSSSGCAAVLGYADGQAIPRDEMMFLLRGIIAAVDVPVTADLEAGYGDAARTALDAVEAGAAGLNFEDMVAGELVPLDEQIERIRAIRSVADSKDVPLVINARTDIFLAGARRRSHAIRQSRAAIERLPHSRRRLLVRARRARCRNHSGFGTRGQWSAEYSRRARFARDR